MPMNAVENEQTPRHLGKLVHNLCDLVNLPRALKLFIARVPQIWRATSGIGILRTHPFLSQMIYRGIARGFAQKCRRVGPKDLCPVQKAKEDVVNKIAGDAAATDPPRDLPFHALMLLPVKLVDIVRVWYPCHRFARNQKSGVDVGEYGPKISAYG